MAELERLLQGLPEGIAVLLDEALVDFADAQPTDASLELLEEHPRLLVFRSFSKAWGLAGLRVGYAVGGPGSEELLAELEPDLGVSELSQAGALEALRSGAKPLTRHVQSVCEERPRLTAELRERGFEVTDSQANFLWVAHPQARRHRAGHADGTRGRAGCRRRRRWASRVTCASRCATPPPPPRRAERASDKRRSAELRRRPDSAGWLWRSSAPVVPSRIRRQALESCSCSSAAVSASKCSTTVRSRSGEMSIPCRLVTSR